ncbi:MAG: DNA polymerase III subunit beta [Minisyncoccia bacterium]
MEVLCNTEKLKEFLDYADKIVTRHLTLPILNNFLIKTERNGLKISSTNLEIGITSWLPCKVEKSGEITVPARIFSGIVSSLVSDKVILELKKDKTLSITSGNYRASLKGESADDFPIIPSLKKENGFGVPTKLFTKSLNQIAGFVSNSETRPEITGVFISKEQGENFLRLAATDSFRLGEKIILLDNRYLEAKFSIIIPARTCAEVIRIFSNMAGDLLIVVEKNQIGFELGKVEVVSRLIEGQYPDYRKLIPQEFNLTASLVREDFVRTVKLVSLLSSRVSDIKLSFRKGKESKLTMYAADSDLGENDAELPADVSGEDLEVKFNWRYLVDGVAGLLGRTVVFNFIDETKPCLIKSPEDKDFLYLVMPIRA